MFVFAGGLKDSSEGSVVAADGTVIDGPSPGAKDLIGGFTVVDIATREAALRWAAKIAVACRCAKEVREFLSDPTLRGRKATVKVATRAWCLPDWR